MPVPFQVEVLDSTLREGEQHPHVRFGVAEKLAIARCLDAVGVGFIEVGNPMADTDVAAVVAGLSSQNLRAKLVVHSRLREADLQAALDTGAGMVGMFLCPSPERLEKDLRWNLPEAIGHVSRLVGLAKQRRPEVLVRCTVEDALRCPSEAICTMAEAAANAGADILSLADTTGCGTSYRPGRSLPALVKEVLPVLARTGQATQLAVHCHNDRGLALANALEAVAAGVRLVDASVLGLGERSGIPDLAALLVNLTEWPRQERRWRLDLLPELYEQVSRITRVPVPGFQPLVGDHAFTHTAGVHLRAMARNPGFYQDLDPAFLGRRWNLSLGKLSGRAAIRLALEQLHRFDLAADEMTVVRLLEAVKQAARQGRDVDLTETFPALVRELTEASSPAPVATPAGSQNHGHVPSLDHPEGGFEPFSEASLKGSIVARFREIAARFTERPAIITEEQTFTYAEVDSLSDRVARALLHESPEPEEPIGLFLGHDANTIISLLGVLKAGKFYVPLDPTYPERRLRQIIDDAGIKRVLTDAAHALAALGCVDVTTRLLEFEVLTVAGAESGPVLPLPQPAPNQTAYLIYTSGSTGEPKGVIQTHRTVLHNVCSYSDGIHISRHDRMSLLARFSFSASISGMFGGLLNGAAILPYDVKRRGLGALPGWLNRQAVTIYHSVPTIFRQWVRGLTAGENLGSVRLIKLGGEPVFRGDFELYRRHFSDRCVFHVGFGCTECNIVALFFAGKDTVLPGPRVPVGLPPRGIEILLLDETGRPGAASGEIVLRGRHLSPGYWRRPEINARVFQPDPMDPEWQLYRTGDFGERTPDGCLIHLGRRDAQVKINGQRVELGEIEAALGMCPKVRESAVMAHHEDEGRVRLIAYITAQAGTEPTPDELRQQLASLLPPGLIPGQFVILDRLPATGTGKLDRKALPVPAVAAPLSPRPAPPASQALETQLCDLWRQVLRCREVTPHDNFFQRGGDSLAAVELSVAVEQAFGRRFTPESLLYAPTVAEQTALLAGKEEPESQHAFRLRRGPEGPALFLLPGLDTGLLRFRHLLAHLAPTRSVWGLQSPGFDSRRGRDLTVEAIADQLLPVLRSLQPTGPYYLLGHSLGGSVAFELARRLQAGGVPAGWVGLLDSHAPVPVVHGLDALKIRSSTAFYWSRRGGYNLRLLLRRPLREWGDHLTRTVGNTWRNWFTSAPSSPAAAPNPAGSVQTSSPQPARKHYRPAPADVAVTYFLARQDQLRVDPRTAWRALARKGLRVVSVPGDHSSLLTEQHAAELAVHVEACLAEATTAHARVQQPADLPLAA